MRLTLMALAIASLLACDKKKDGADLKPTEPAAGQAQPAAGQTDPAAGAATDVGAAVGRATAAAGAAADQAGQAAAQAGEAANRAGAAALAAGDQAVDQAAGAAASAADVASKAAAMGAEAAEKAAAAGTAAAGAAAGAATTLSASAGVAHTAPADFPLPVPSGVTGSFTDRTSGGQRRRSAFFAYTGSADDLAAQFEKGMKDRGLEPQVKKVTLGTSQIVTVKASKGDIEAKAVINGAKGGTNSVTLIWREPAR